ncbi:mitochondrial intermediate peptidase, mitochondrial isoform X2 [Elaeis guineensis]|uniref:Mitochondrial intermediate peptidase, mitochondrial n=1 Tax=Elaeis guineensis var. tenera TaxID=51953 RepID=A0A6I9R1S1_ELAGV|nr:mitochondrial intermediate peptidase, mitochondrial [Elaeis guineensis]
MASRALAIHRRAAPRFFSFFSPSRRLSVGSCFDATVAYGEGARDTGLYGFPVLKTAKGFRRFVDDAIERSGELVSYVSQLPPSMEVIRVMDEISNTVCSVIDSAELCRNTHPDREYVEEANKASMRIHEYLHFLNTNYSLYNAVIKAELEGNLITEEAQRAAQTLRIDFEKGGIHLCAEKLERVNQLNMEIALLGRQFNENIITDPGFVDIFPASRIPKHMQPHFKPIYRPIPTASEESMDRQDRKKEKGFRIATDSSTLSSVLKWVSDAEVRKQSYIKGNSTPQANLDVLDKLISARHELAEIMGCKSYAEFAIRPNMAASPDVVMSFLLDLSKTVRKKADEEFKIIKDFKRRFCNERSADLEPWDEAYFTGMMKSSTYDLDSLVISSYFSLSQCLEGLKLLVESLFGATFHRIPVAPGESWHPDVVKLSLHHPQEGDLGFLYLDLYSRKGKYPGCAHFAIRGGRRVSETEYQLPIVALVCNFPGSPGSSTSRLNHWDVETLFHEFGHALHSLLSRTDYQHFSGTRVVLDLAETPSNLFEYYAWDYRVLRTFARHDTTGEVIPKKLVAAMNGARNMFVATEFQRQIFYSLMDLTLFGEQPATPRDTISVVADLKKQHTSWNHVEGTHWHTRFNHLINYGAGYYSYLYARCFAATIWQEICCEHPLSHCTGSAIRTKFLQHGGAKDPSDLLKELAGNSVIRNCSHGIVPDTSSLLKEIGF